MKAWLWLLLSFVVAGTTWAYTHRVLVPWEYQVNVVSGNIKAPMGDLYSPWVGTQALLIHRLNPYGPEVSREIQIGFYGHPVVQDLQQPSRTPVDEQRFAYPVFVAFLLAPAIHAPFPEVQRWAEVVLAILVAASTLLWLDFASWGPSKIATLAIIVLVISSPQIVQGLRFRQLALVVGFLLAAATWCVRKNHLATAGVLLAISTIKPQMILPVLVWFLLWAASEWRARWRLIAGFTGMFLLLIGAGELLLPGWIGYFLQGLAAYQKYLRRMSLLELALGQFPGYVCAALIIVFLFGLAWKNRKEAADSEEFAISLSAFFLATTLVMPLPHPFNQVMLMLPVLILLRDWQALPAWSRLLFTAWAAWPCIASLALLLFSHPIHAPSRLALLPSFVAPFVPFILPVLLIGRQKSLATRAALPL